MHKEEVEEFLKSLEALDDKIKRREKINERISRLRSELDFAIKHDIADYKILEIYKPYTNNLEAENRLLMQMQNSELLEDIEGLIQLNQHYIRKTKEQFDEIESLRTKLAKGESKATANQLQTLKAELQETKQKLQARNKRVKELNEKVDFLQAKRKVSRELSPKEQKILKFFNTPRAFIEDSKKWYLKPFKYFFKK